MYVSLKHPRPPVATTRGSRLSLSWDDDQRSPGGHLSEAQRLRAEPARVLIKSLEPRDEFEQLVRGVLICMYIVWDGQRGVGR